MTNEREHSTELPAGHARGAPARGVGHPCSPACRGDCLLVVVNVLSIGALGYFGGMFAVWGGRNALWGLEVYLVAVVILLSVPAGRLGARFGWVLPALGAWMVPLTAGVVHRGLTIPFQVFQSRDTRVRKYPKPMAIGGTV
jgi:hypothetical protein